MKQKISYSCQSCSYKTVKWLGCCPECSEWDTFQKQQSVGKTKHGVTKKTTGVHLTTLENITTKKQERMRAGIGEWDRVIGDGIVPGSLLILTGDPGIGKSTLLLQVAHYLAKKNTVFYFSTEESLQQVKLRAQRLNIDSSLLFCDVAQIENIIATIEQHQPDLVIIDSIQNCYSASTTNFAGSVAQLREITFELMRLAKENNIAIILSGHVTKEGYIAGPKTLEHMVDAVFYLQKEDRWQTRILRAVKNRFGTINELGFFQMGENGMQEIANINQNVLNESSPAAGSVLVSVLEGSRPLLIELQALTIPSKLAVAQRVISGVDHKQVVLIAAILEKYLQIKLSSQDIFFKISGGMKIKSSCIDLGIALALLSSYFQLPLPKKSLALGELSLTGQIKPINHFDQFAKEAKKFGFEHLFVAKNQTQNKTNQLVSFATVYELLKLFTNE